MAPTITKSDFVCSIAGRLSIPVDFTPIGRKVQKLVFALLNFYAREADPSALPRLLEDESCNLLRCVR